MADFRVTIPGVLKENTAGSPYLCYCVYIHKESTGEVAFLKRRFSEFFKLHSSLQGKQPPLVFPSFASFPRRAVFNNMNPSIVEERRKLLEAYLNELLAMKPVAVEVLAFLELTNYNLFDARENGEGAVNQPDAEADTKKPAESVEHRDTFTTEGGKPTTPTEPMGETKKPTVYFPRIHALAHGERPFSNKKDELSKETPRKEESPAEIPLDETKRASALEDVLHWNVRLWGCIALVMPVLGLLQLSWMVCVHGVSLVWIYRIISTSILSFLSHWRVAIEVVVSLIALHVFFHRIVGWALGRYLTQLLGTPAGAFQFQFGWIAIRLGLDVNEVVVSDFIWRNPPRFDKTPCFVKVHHLLLRFDLMSVISAIRFGKSIRVNYVELSNVDVYIEKGKKKEGLNLWAALGADSASDEKSVESSVMNSIAKAVKATAGASSHVLDAFVKYNPASLIYNKVSLLAGSSSSNDLNRKASEDDAVGRDSLAMEDEGRESVNEFNQAESNDVSGVPIPVEPSAPVTPISNQSKVAAETPKSPKENSHWGVPYTLETDLITVRNVNLFALDFLNAEHSSNSLSQSHAIKISLMNMTRRELTDKPLKKKQNRRGVHLDDLVWRIIAKVINELIAHNKIAMTTILASAAANQTSAAVIGSVTNVAKGMADEIYNYNPKTLFNGATTLTSKAFNAISSNEKLRRSKTVEALDVRKLKIRLVKARNLRVHDKAVGACFCSINLERQSSGDSSHTTVKSSTKRVGGEGVFSWGETFELLVYNMRAVLVIKVYETKVLGKDTSFCRLEIPLGDATGIREEEPEEETKELNESCEAVCQMNDTEETTQRKVSGKSRVTIVEPNEIDAVEKQQPKHQPTFSLINPENLTNRRVGVKSEVVLWHKAEPILKNIGGDGTGTSAEVYLGLSLL